MNGLTRYRLFHHQTNSTIHEVPSMKKTKRGASSTGTTFTVHDVVKSNSKLPVSSTPADILRSKCGVQPEAYSGFTHAPFITESDCNAFIMAVHTAFSQHYPIVFTPDAIWLCIMQGLSAHINSNADKLRHHFVEFEGKKKVEIRLQKLFVKGSSSNPWPEVFDLFSARIKDHIGDKTHHLLTPEFSTTGPIERAAAQIVLLDSFKQYFEYYLRTLCGIPSITLEGTVEDWKLLQERALALRQYELDWWINELEPVLDQFVAAASGNVDKEFWAKIYKLENGYTDKNINGWILTLFPYLKNDQQNRCLSAWKKDDFWWGTGIITPLVLSGVATVPFTWNSVPDNKTYNMSFFAGFMAATQDPDTLAIHPEIGWAVAERNEEVSDEPKKCKKWSPWH